MIGQDIAAALPELRAQAESLMTDTCTIDRQDGPPVWDEALQKSVASWVTVHADVPCHVDEPQVTAVTSLTDEMVTAHTPLVKIPVTYAGIEPDDRVTITAVGSESDPALLDAVMWVTHNRARTTAVQRRLECRWTR